MAAGWVEDVSSLIESLRNADFSSITNSIITSLYIDTGIPRDETTQLTASTHRTSRVLDQFSASAPFIFMFGTVCSLLLKMHAI
jgi:hypothetical protein